jgi:SAM-dependent methyltransferase
MTSRMFKEVRLAEVEDSIALLRKYKDAGDLLEIGAGTGWQSKALSDAGYRVEAVDLPADSDISNHARSREWPIRDYDGAHLPFPNQAFDIVYSSNVLEHVVELDTLTEEIKRVLRPGGIALHVVPNSGWRLLSLATYYPGQAIDAVRWLRRKPLPHARGNRESADAGNLQRSLLHKAVRRLLPPTHGSVGSPITELTRFSKRAWDNYFRQTGWEVLHYCNNGLLASGDYLFGTLLAMSQRRRLGRIAGGIAHVYVLRPKAKQ